MKKIVIFAIAFIFMPCAATAYQKPKPGGAGKLQSSYAHVEIYSSDMAPHPYIILGAVSAETSGINSARKKLQKITAKAGGDAILNFEISAATYVRLAKGIAVRWAKDGEKGITSISPQTPIPVLITK